MLEVKRTPSAGIVAEAIESMQLLDGGREAYPRMLMALGKAEKSVYLEVYAFAPEGVGERFVEELGQAKLRGASVQVLIDGWGSARGARAVASALRSSGCTVRIYSRLLRLFTGHFGRNHRKILLIDDKVAFIGGINIGDENLDKGTRQGWADLALEVHGTECARLREMIRGKRYPTGDARLKIFLSGLGGGWRLRRRYLKAFAGAKRTISLAHGYFLPDRAIVRAIIAATRRGVLVRLLLAGQSDVPFSRAATRSLYYRFFAAGVLIHEWTESVLHAKIAIVDGKCLLVGSFNLDPFSLANLEVLAEVTEPIVVHQGEEWIEGHIKRSPLLPSAVAVSPMQRWLVDPIGRVIAQVADAAGRAIIGRRRKFTAAGRRSQSNLTRLVRKTIIAVTGSSILGFGIALIVLPGPAFVFIPLGLAILATEFRWALHLIIRLKICARAKLQSGRRTKSA